MSICEHISCDSSSKSSGSKLNIQNELLWGLTYRNYKENEKHKPIRPMHSPIDIPFKICRAEMMLSKEEKRKNREKRKEKQDEANKSDKKGAGDKPSFEEKPEKSKNQSIKRKREPEKPTLLDRNVMSQSKYMDFLSLPNPKFYEEPKAKKYKKRCELEPCPPRFVQLAVPNKRRVFANWKEYRDFLPTEMLKRFEEILHTDQNLEPREARYYYKKIDRQKRRERRRKRRMEKKKKQEKEKDADWVKIQIDSLTYNIVEYIQDEPLFALNYKQMLLSDGILERLERTAIIKKPSRKTKNYYKKTIIEAADKFAVWIDTLTRFVDIQAIESDEDIPPLSITSLGEEEGESEGESEFESESSEGELTEDQLFAPEEAWEEGAEGDYEDMDQEAIDTADKLISDILSGSGEEGGGTDDLLREIDDNLLDKLIEILSNSPDDFLEGLIDDENMPGVRYIDVLEKVKELREGTLPAKAGENPRLEQIMVNWALKNDPDNVDQPLQDKIHEVAGMLDEWLTTGAGDRGEEGKKAGEQEEAGEFAAGGTEEGEEGQGSEVNPESEVGQGGEEGVGGEEGEEGEGSPETPGGPQGQAGEEGAEDIDGMDTTKGESGAEGVEGEGEGGEKGGMKGSESFLTEGEEGVESHASQGTNLDYDADTGAEEDGGVETEQELETTEITDLEGEEAIGGEVPEYEYGLGEEEGEEGIDIIYGPETAREEEEKKRDEEKQKEEEREKEKEEAKRLDGQVIKGHKPEKTFEHSPDTVCCLSLKTWAVWLLEITHNAHSWTQWVHCVIQQVREFASIVRGDVKLPNGETKVLKKAEWRQFIKDTEEHVVAWRQYSAHVKDLSQSIIENYHGKAVNCCPKCLQDHLIKDVVVAHDTLQALTEAISCAAYWQRSLDALVEKTCGLTNVKKAEEDGLSVSSEESSESASLESIEEEESAESVYEIEEFETSQTEIKKEDEPEETNEKKEKKGKKEKKDKKKK